MLLNKYRATWDLCIEKKKILSLVMAIYFIFFFLVSAFIGVFRCDYRGYKVQTFLVYMTLLEITIYLVVFALKQEIIIKNDCLEPSIDQVFNKAIDRVFEVLLDSYGVICLIILFFYIRFFVDKIEAYYKAKFLTENPVSF